MNTRKLLLSLALQLIALQSRSQPFTYDLEVIGSPIPWFVTTTLKGAVDSIERHYYYQGSIPVYFHTHGEAQTASVYKQTSASTRISFNLDTTQTYIESLLIQHDTGDNFSGTSIKIRFDSLASTSRQSNIINIRGSFKCLCDMQAAISRDHTPGGGYEFGTQDTIFEAADTVNLTIVLNELKVPHEYDDKSTKFQRALDVRIYDLAGRVIKAVECSDLNYLTEVQLPPGCYFARLTSANGASEVVKFVVAP